MYLVVVHLIGVPLMGEHLGVHLVGVHLVVDRPRFDCDSWAQILQLNRDFQLDKDFQLDRERLRDSAGQVSAEPHGSHGGHGASREGKVSLSIAFLCVYKYQLVVQVDRQQAVLPQSLFTCCAQHIS